jgi:hypothetical protein
MVEVLKNDKKIKDFFKEEGDTMINLSDHIRNTVVDMLNIPLIKSQSHTHFDEAKKMIAANVTGQMPEMIKENKEFFNNFLTQSAKTVTANHEIFSTIIHAANFDSRWKSLLLESLPTAKTLSSVDTLADQLKTTKIDTIENTKATKENKNNLLKAARQIGHLKTSQIENSFRAVETQIRIHNINTIKSDDNKDFRSLDDKQQQNEIHKILSKHTNGTKSGTINIFKPRTGAKQFESLALVTFHTTTLKYAFERSFAAWKRESPTKNEKLTISRAPPGRAPGDETQKQPKDIKREIATLFHNAIDKAKAEHPTKNIKQEHLTDEQILAMPVQLKTKYKPFATYWEFLCPTNNITYNIYTPGRDPFDNFDFHREIPNPTTRNEAITKPEYKNYYKLKTYKKRET